MVIKKLWLILPSKLLYRLSSLFLKFYIFFSPKKERPTWMSFNWRSMHFPNRLGTAGGVDKNAKHILDWQQLGAGFLEVGTITPLYQRENSGKTLKRDIQNKSLWNFLGFPNKGVKFSLKQIKKAKPLMSIPLFINIGKNRSTKLENAQKDYIQLMEQLHEFADTFIINISSPNTKDLRNLFHPKNLKPFLNSIHKKAIQLKPYTPIILKLSPDLNDTEFLQIIEESLPIVDGWCICNTTTKRKAQVKFPKHGGISGKLLTPHSLYWLKKLSEYLESKNPDLKKDKLIVSTGGIFSAKDILERIECGAHLVQVYSALVFEGPNFFHQISEEIKKQTVLSHKLKILIK